MGKKRKSYLGFVDLEKAFDRVPREVVKWALRKGVEEWLIKTVMYTYVGASVDGSICYVIFGTSVGLCYMFTLGACRYSCNGNYTTSTHMVALIC